jgi:hypothetical protein
VFQQLINWRYNRDREAAIGENAEYGVRGSAGHILANSVNILAIALSGVYVRVSREA